MKLITLSEFILKKDKQIRKGSSDVYDFTMSVTDYALFLQRPLELGMFVPCDEYGDVLKHPNYIKGNRSADLYNLKMYEYLDAKDKVLFEVEGFEQNVGEEKQYFNVLKNVYNNIESFIDYEDFKLTQTALEESRLITLI